MKRNPSGFRLRTVPHCSDKEGTRLSSLVRFLSNPASNPRVNEPFLSGNNVILLAKHPLLARVRSRFLPEQQEPAPFPVPAIPALCLNPLGATGLIRLFPHGFLGPNGSRDGMMGYYNDYPVAGKVVENSIYYRSRAEERCPRGHLSGLLDTSLLSGQKPYLGPPELAERARTLKTMLFALFLVTFWTVFSRTPFPSRRFSRKPRKRRVRKETIYIDFFDYF